MEDEMKGFDDLFQVHGCSLYMYMYMYMKDSEYANCT